MNEQIKRFSEQAINYATSNRPLPDLKDKDLFLNNLFERFAKLIVKECMQLNSKELSITAIERLLPMYREHFGVEE